MKLFRKKFKMFPVLVIGSLLFIFGAIVMFQVANSKSLGVQQEKELTEFEVKQLQANRLELELLEVNKKLEAITEEKQSIQDQLLTVYGEKKIAMGFQQTQ